MGKVKVTRLEVKPKLDALDFLRFYLSNQSNARNEEVERLKKQVRELKKQIFENKSYSQRRCDHDRFFPIDR